MKLSSGAAGLGACRGCNASPRPRRRLSGSFDIVRLGSHVLLLGHVLQVPFINWFGHMPRVQGVVATAVPAVTPWLFGHAGRQFFFTDEPGDEETEPIIVSIRLSKTTL